MRDIQGRGAPEPREDDGPSAAEGARLVDQQRMLAEFGSYALGAHDLDDVLREACRLVLDGLGERIAKVVEARPDGRLCLRMAVGFEPTEEERWIPGRRRLLGRPRPDDRRPHDLARRHERPALRSGEGDEAPRHPLAHQRADPRPAEPGGRTIRRAGGRQPGGAGVHRRRGGVPRGLRQPPGRGDRAGQGARPHGRDGGGEGGAAARAAAPHQEQPRHGDGAGAAAVARGAPP